MGFVSSLHICYSTSNPTHPWWYESCLPGGLFCHFFRGELGCACITPFSLLPHPQDRGISYGEVRATAHEQSDGLTAHYTCKVTEGG